MAHSYTDFGWAMMRLDLMLLSGLLAWNGYVDNALLRSDFDRMPWIMATDGF